MVSVSINLAMKDEMEWNDILAEFFFCNISRLWTFQIRLTIDHSWQIEITTFRVHSDWQPESDLDSNSCDVWECLANINALARIGWLASLISFTLPWPIWYSPHVPGLIFNSEKLNGRPTISTEENLSLSTKFHIDDTNLIMIWHNHNSFSRAISLRSTRAYRPKQSSTSTKTDTL